MEDNFLVGSDPLSTLLGECAAPSNGNVKKSKIKDRVL
jgi:hypothetical protein